MTPILYESTETAFTSNGLGRLADAVTCKVTEERNGVYELEMTYPVTGVHYADISENRIILAQPHDGGLTEPFQIYKITKPLNGIITVNAEHISYRLNSMVCMPFTAGTIREAMVDVKNNTVGTNPFNFTTDIQSTADYSVEIPTNIRSILCGRSGSILDTYGHGDYEFRRWDVILHENRGADNGVTLRYGKNITDFKHIADMTNVYTGIVPYWTNGDNMVTLPEKVIMSSHASDYPFNIIKPVDLSSYFQEAPAAAQLRAQAQSYVESNEGWKLNENITISFVALWNTEEYKNIAPLERVKMCDTVHVVYTPYGLNFSTRVVKTDYNVLQERYNSITLGDTYFTLGEYFSSEVEKVEQSQTTHMQKAIARATKLIQGGLGGHVVFNTNADGEPEEILIMDTDDIMTAVNVIRMNLSGIGFSTHGYNGPFETAWTIDGHFVADFIDTGTLTADIVKTGVLADENGNTTFNLETGALVSKNLTIDSRYFKLSNTGKITSITEDGRKLTMEKGRITGYRVDGSESAALEIGDGYFNIIGKLALNGVVGVSGATSFVKDVGYSLDSLGSVVTSINMNYEGFLEDASLIANPMLRSASVTVSGYVGTEPASLSGTVTYQDTTYTLNKTTKYRYGLMAASQRSINYSRAIVADTGAINSSYGIIQSIS